MTITNFLELVPQLAYRRADDSFKISMFDARELHAELAKLQQDRDSMYRFAGLPI